MVMRPPQWPCEALSVGPATLRQDYRPGCLYPYLEPWGWDMITVIIC